MTGRNQREEILGHSVLEWTSPHDIERNEREVRKCIAQGFIHDLEMNYVTTGGQFIPIEINATVFRAAGTTRILTLCRDITERKRAEDALRNSERRLLAILDATPFPIALVDLSDNNIEFWSHSAVTLFGHTAPTAAQWYQMAYPDPDYRREVFDRWKLALEKARLSAQTINTGVYRVTCRDGSMRICELYVCFLADTLIVTFNDITERQRAEDDLKHTTENLRRSNRDLEQFAYVASHDLQEPLRMVTGYMDLLERMYKGRLDKDADQFIAFAVEGAHRMQHLIADLLAYSRITSRGKEPQRVAVQAAYDRSVADLRGLIAETGAQITHDSLPEVVGDETQLTQLLMNLFSNAIKFRGKQPPRIHLGARREGSEWIFSVADNGIGMAPESFERIFQVFQRLHTREEYPGSGIGLAICKKIVERHGGRIWVESQVGRGSTFFFAIPGAIA